MAEAADRRAVDGLDGLDVLGAVVEAGSFVRAGETLGLTQSAVSRAVARLEERVGVRLFRRTARAIALTDEGRRFYEAVAPHVAAIEDASIAAGGAATHVRGRLRVNVDTVIAQLVLTPRLEPFMARHPELAVELVLHDRLGDLVGEGFDVALRFGRRERSALQARLLMRTRVVTCASPAYLARQGTPRHPDELAGGRHACVRLRDPALPAAEDGHVAWRFVRGQRSRRVDVTGQLVVNETGALLAACVGGQGLAQLNEVHARALLADGRLVQLFPEWSDATLPLYAYHQPAPLLSAKVRVFLDFVIALTR